MMKMARAMMKMARVMMKNKSIGFHTRLCSDDTKVTGGSFGGRIDDEIMRRLKGVL